LLPNSSLLQADVAFAMAAENFTGMSQAWLGRDCRKHSSPAFLCELLHNKRIPDV
jgi:hypothetical protein